MQYFRPGDKELNNHLSIAGIPEHNNELFHNSIRPVRVRPDTRQRLLYLGFDPKLWFHSFSHHDGCIILAGYKKGREEATVSKSDEE